jgi:CDP-glycerol glycerophosphotransferase (TagB/SpsB family)
VRALDHGAGRLLGRRRILVDARSPLNFAVMAPVVEALRRDPRVDVDVTSEGRHDITPVFEQAGLARRIVDRQRVTWTRYDLYLNADPWNPPPLARAARRISFFHGVAGKYDLDQPKDSARPFDGYDRVAFINTDRMNRYLDARIVTPGQAALVGYPKLDALACGAYDAASVRAALRFDNGRPTVIYAPTWSPASSLHVAGEAIIEALLARGFNVIAKLHDNCFLLADKYAAGIDWRTRLSRFSSSGRFALVEAADASPYLAASDAMVTDHSSIGFEYLVLDRPLAVFDAPDLATVARINPEKVALLRSAATVATTASQLAGQVAASLAHPSHLAGERRRTAEHMFHRPGTATARALALAYDLLGTPAGGLL